METLETERASRVEKDVLELLRIMRDLRRENEKMLWRNDP
jgi:hypothetical protein